MFSSNRHRKINKKRGGGGNYPGLSVLWQRPTKKVQPKYGKGGDGGGRGGLQKGGGGEKGVNVLFFRKFCLSRKQTKLFL